MFCLFFLLDICGYLNGDNIEKWKKFVFGPEWTMPDCAVLLVIVCVYEKKIIIKSLDINKTLLTFISMDVATPPYHPRAATCNSLQEIGIFFSVKSPLIGVVYI